MPTPPPEPKFTAKRELIATPPESKTKRAMAGKETWRKIHGTFVFTQKVDGLQGILEGAPPPSKLGDASDIPGNASEVLGSQLGCLSYFHKRISYQIHTEMRLPDHAQQMSEAKSRALK